MSAPHITENPSPSDLAMDKFAAQAKATLAQLAELNDDEFATYLLTAPTLPQLQGCIFVGHKATDLDSIASAVACAELFGGTAARASEVNSETRCALDLWHVPLPETFSSACERLPNAKIVLCDHNQMSQSPDGLDLTRLHGCIDHHAMQGRTVMTSAPIYVCIQPWGSACTIVAHMFFAARRKMTRHVAGMLLSGIVSDTLNLRSPTTTDPDRHAVTLLARLVHDSPVGRCDVTALARTLFKAKSREVLLCTPHQLVRGDLKTFECRCNAPRGALVALEGDGAPAADAAAAAAIDAAAAAAAGAETVLSMAFGVIETTDLSTLTPLKAELQKELRALKREERRDLAFLALVDIDRLHSLLVTAGERELSLAMAAFPGAKHDEASGLLDIGSRVSRKKDLIPFIEACLRDGSGWVPPPLSAAEARLAATEQFGRVAIECTDHGCQLVRHEVEEDAKTADVPAVAVTAD